MITNEAKRSIEAIFEQAAKSRLTATAGDSCTTTPVAVEGRADTLGPRAIVLTISSIAFRLLFVLHFSDDDATRAYYVGNDTSRTLPEVLTETGNLCCGYINQQLVTYFPDLGMSTPYELASRCVDHLGELKPDHVWAYDLQMGGAARLGVTLCVCAKARLDFVANVADEAQSEGELELF
ncbi:hypothetical protein [Paraburkholderia phosphatilytica]|uniref:hypothetical protein n=1 Tax=Paraburkholderia phosphatilytica TaxID=2282883 RepID=UPI000E4F812F|nr:hypothetical protein [Paraburkholderia phosphatilytica]